MRGHAWTETRFFPQSAGDTTGNWNMLVDYKVGGGLGDYWYGTVYATPSLSPNAGEWDVNFAGVWMQTDKSGATVVSAAHTNTLILPP